MLIKGTFVVFFVVGVPPGHLAWNVSSAFQACFACLPEDQQNSLIALFSRNGAENGFDLEHSNMQTSIPEII